MVYNLMLKLGKDKYYPVDISKSDLFKRTSKLKNNCYRINEIDNFTMNFENEEKLKIYLVEQGLINFKDIEKELSIRIKKGSKYEKVYYGIPYSKDKKLFNYHYLISKLAILANDYEFSRKFASRFRNHHMFNECIGAIYDNLSGVKEADFIRVFKLLFQDALLKVNKDTGEVTVNERTLHDIAMYVSYYENEMENTKLSSQEKKKTLTKDKEQENKEIDGQTSLF